MLSENVDLHVLWLAGRVVLGRRPFQPLRSGHYPEILHWHKGGCPSYLILSPMCPRIFIITFGRLSNSLNVIYKMLQTIPQNCFDTSQSCVTLLKFHPRFITAATSAAECVLICYIISRRC